MKKVPDRQKVLAVVGSPLSVTSLDEGITDKLELRGYRIARMPFAEMMLLCGLIIKWVLYRIKTGLAS